MITLPPEVIPVVVKKVVGGGVEREYDEVVIPADDEVEMAPGIIDGAVVEVDTGATGVVEVEVVLGGVVAVVLVGGHD